MSLLGAALAGMTGAGQAFLAKKQRQQALKNTIDLEKYRNDLFIRKLKEQQTLRDKINALTLKKHQIDVEAQNKLRMDQTKIGALKDACLRGSASACKSLRDNYGIDMGQIAYPIGKPHPKSQTGEKLTAYSTRLAELNRQLKSIEAKNTNTIQQIVKDPITKAPIGFKSKKDFNPNNMNPSDRKRYMDLRKAIYETMSKMGRVQGLPPINKPPSQINEGKNISGIKQNEYGPGLLTPVQIEKINQAGLTQYDIDQAINKFQIEHPEIKESRYQLLQRIVNGL